MRKLSALIVDDEPLARETLRDLIGGDDQVVVIGECRDGSTALAEIVERRPDIVFLDIEMPNASGLELLEVVEPSERPVAVFVTAYEKHALEAFGLEAVDYVLKPFSDERFLESLARAKRRARERGTGRDEPEYLDRIVVKKGSRKILLAVDDIRRIESEDYYTRLYLPSESYLLRRSLTSLEASLDPRLFQRVHRTAIIRRDTVSEVRRLSSGGGVLLLDDGVEVKVSRSRIGEVESWLMPVSG